MSACGRLQCFDHAHRPGALACPSSATPIFSFNFRYRSKSMTGCSSARAGSPTSPGRLEFCGLVRACTSCRRCEPRLRRYFEASPVVRQRISNVGVTVLRVSSQVNRLDRAVMSIIVSKLQEADLARIPAAQYCIVQEGGGLQLRPPCWLGVGAYMHEGPCPAPKRNLQLAGQGRIRRPPSIGRWAWSDDVSQPVFPPAC